MNKEVVQNLIERSLNEHRETTYFKGYGDDPQLPQTTHPHIEFSPKPRTIIRITWEKQRFSFLHIQVMRIIEGVPQVQLPNTGHFHLRVQTLYKGDIPLDRNNPDAFDLDFMAGIIKNYKSFLN